MELCRSRLVFAGEEWDFCVQTNDMREAPSKTIPWLTRLAEVGERGFRGNCVSNALATLWDTREIAGGIFLDDMAVLLSRGTGRSSSLMRY
jgi:hypothetical protein